MAEFTLYVLHTAVNKVKLLINRLLLIAIFSYIFSHMWGIVQSMLFGDILSIDSVTFLIKKLAWGEYCTLLTNFPVYIKNNNIKAVKKQAGHTSFGD
jgi:hypothetical protein